MRYPSPNITGLHEKAVDVKTTVLKKQLCRVKNELNKLSSEQSSGGSLERWQVKSNRHFDLWEKTVDKKCSFSVNAMRSISQE